MSLPILNSLKDLEDLLFNMPDEGYCFEYSIDEKVIKNNYKFNMINGFNPLNYHYYTTCCIGGWVIACNHEVLRYGFETSLQEALYDLCKLDNPNITLGMCDKICYPQTNFKTGEENPFWKANNKQGAAAIRILRTEGVVDLERAMEE